MLVRSWLVDCLAAAREGLPETDEGSSRRWSRFAFISLILLSFASFSARGQSAPSISSTSVSSTTDSLALTLATQSLQALTRDTAVSDVTLTGTATQIAGSWKNTGPATFKALGTTKSRLDFSAASQHPEHQVQSEIRTLDASGHPAGAWARPDGVKHTVALHNAFTDAAWFFPALGSLRIASQSGVVAKYIGAETHNGIAVKHLRLWRTADASLAAISSVVPRLSTVDIYLDAKSSLPVALAFNTHPDKDLNKDTQVEIRYSDYRQISGINVPLRVQEYVNNGLVMNFQANEVIVNSSLTDAQFGIQ